MAMPATSVAQERSARYQRIDDRAYDNGYRDGLSEGERDARDGREFSFVRAEMYRAADEGYRRDDGDLNDYRQMFRRGFEAGYREGFERNARATARGPYPARPAELSPAAQIGYRDGYDVGRNDFRDHESFDPVRSGRYRSADHHYDSRYGPRDRFQREYRLGFEDGYERGYRGR